MDGFKYAKELIAPFRGFVVVVLKDFAVFVKVKTFVLKIFNKNTSLSP